MFHPVYNRVMAQNISVPDIGDFKDVEVIEILVKPGDQINKNDPIAVSYTHLTLPTIYSV